MGLGFRADCPTREVADSFAMLPVAEGDCDLKQLLSQTPTVTLEFTSICEAIVLTR